VNALDLPGPPRPTAPLLLALGWDRPGGLNRYVQDLHAALLRHGDDPRTLVVGPSSTAPASVVEVTHEDEALLQRLLAYTRAAHRFSRGADVVDAHFALFAFLPVVLRQLHGRRLVVHFHGPWAAESASQDQRTSVASRLKQRIEGTVYRRADAVVVLSEAFRDLLSQTYAVAQQAVHVIPPGVDLERFTPGRDEARRRLGLDLDGHYVFTARRLVPRMGLDVLLEAWAQVADARAVLLVAGEGPLRATLEKRAGELGLTGRVRFLGRVAETDLVDLHRAADVGVVPTTALEGFGLVVLESLACGTPVVVTDVGGLPEALQGLDPSLVVPPGDAEALAARLSAALAGEAPSARQCREHAETFTWERAVSAHDAVYGGRRQGPRTAVFLDHCADLSGGEIALVRTLEGLSARWAPRVLLGEHGPLEERLALAGVPVDVFALDERTASLRRTQLLNPVAVAVGAVRTAGYVGRLSRRLTSEGADVVHANSLKSGLYGSLAARLAGVPMVWHLRDRLASDYLPAPVAAFVRTALTVLPTAVVVNSEATAETLGRRLRRRATVIADPYSPPPAGPRRNGPGPLRIGIVGRISAWKGQDVFVEALATLRTRPFQARIIGSPMFGDDAVLTQLRRRVSELGLDDRVEFTGFTDDVESALAELDVLVHASTIPEPFGQVVVEGMAAGVAVVAADAGGPAEIVTDGVDGLLYRPGDVAQLSAALERLADDPGLRERLGAAARRRAADYRPEAVVPALERVLDEIGRRP